MATIVERPMSIVRESPVDFGAAIPQRRPRESTVEIIDVDVLDTPQPPPAQRRRIVPEVIDLANSDIEDELIPRPQRTSTRAGRSRFFSPPPPLQTPERVPAVPRLPTALDSMRFRVRSRQRPQTASTSADNAGITGDMSGVVRARDNDSLSHLIAAGSNATPARGSAVTVSVSSSHTPPPGSSQSRQVVPLGGALMSSHQRPRPRVVMQERRPLSHAHRPRRVPPRELAEDEHGDLVNIRYMNLQRTSFGVMRDYFVGLRDGDVFGFQEGWGGPATWGQWGTPREAREEEEYDPTYTHPRPADASYTFDLSAPPPSESSAGPFPSTSKSNPIIIDDDEVREESSLSWSTVLVCANCSAPLVTGGSSKESKVWGLRCGHIIDGVCLEKLAVPIPLIGEEPRQGKGKGRALPLPDVAGTSSGDDDEFVVGEEDETEDIPGAFEPASMRSRLRSHRSIDAPDDSGSTLLESLASPLRSILRRSRPTRGPDVDVGAGGSLGKRKRKTRAPAKPKIQDTYQWQCPVAGCGRVHGSLKIGGVWVQASDSNQSGPGTGKGKSKAKEKLEGAVNLFV